jgi:biotin carboxylase
LSEAKLEPIKDVCRRAIESLGIANGVTHIELIFNDHTGRIDLLEIGIRGGGGHVFSTIMQEVTGVCGPSEYAKIVCGVEPNLNATKNSGCVYRFFNPEQRGVIEKLTFPKWFCSERNLIDYGFIAKVGDSYDGLVDSLCRIGYLVVRGENRSAAMLNADFFESHVEIIIK